MIKNLKRRGTIYGLIEAFILYFAPQIIAKSVDTSIT
jgi:hypothetical protein